MESHISESSGGGEVARGDRDMGTEKWDVLSDLRRGRFRSFQGEETRFRGIACTCVQNTCLRKWGKEGRNIWYF